MAEVFKNTPVVPQTTKSAVIVGKVELKPRTEYKSKTNPRGKAAPSKTQKAQAKPAQKAYSADPKLANQQVFQELQFVKKQLAELKIRHEASLKREIDLATNLAHTGLALGALFGEVEALKIGAVTDGAPISVEQLFTPETLAAARKVLGR